MPQSMATPATGGSTNVTGNSTDSAASGPTARERTDQGADEAPKKAVEEVGRFEDDAEAL